MTATPILEHLAALADGTRARLMHVLEGQELTVSDLCAVLQLPQSTVSRHLKILSDDGWVLGRADGTSRRYRIPALAADRRRLWELVRGEVSAADLAEMITDWMWFGSQGLAEVYTTRLWLGVGVFFASSILSALLLYLNWRLAWAFARPPALFEGQEEAVPPRLVRLAGGVP